MLKLLRNQDYVSDFNFFYVKIATPRPPEKSHPRLSQPPPFLKIWLEAQPPCIKGGCTLW